MRVQAEALPWNSDEQRQFFVINLEGDSPGFDVMMLDVIWVPEFARAGWLLDLTPEARAERARRVLPLDRRGGDLRRARLGHALEHERGPALLPAPISSPSTVWRRPRRGRSSWPRPSASAPPSGTRGSTAVLWQGKQYEGLMVNVLEGLWADGTELLGDGGAIFPDPARAEAVLAFMRGLITRGVSPPWTTAADEELTRRAFGRGEAVFLRNWPYALDLLEQRRLAGAGPRGHRAACRAIGTARAGRARRAARIWPSTGARGIPTLALELVRALTSESAQRLMVTGAALYPTRVALYHAPDLVRAQPALPAIAALTLAGRPRPVTPYYVTISTLLQPELSAALVGVKSPRERWRDARRAVGFVLRDVRADAAGAPR